MRIVVTRPEGQERDLVARLERLGHDVVHCPLIAIEPLGDEPIDVSGYDWVVVTSANGARELLRRASGTHAAARGDRPCHGRGARRRRPRPGRRDPGGAPRRAPTARRPGAVRRGRGCAQPCCPSALGADVVTLYRTRELRPADLPPADVYVLASASSARALAALATGLPVVSIGPETSRAARQAGLDVVAEAEEHSSAGLAAAVAGLPGGSRAVIRPAS